MKELNHTELKAVAGGTTSAEAPKATTQQVATSYGNTAIQPGGGSPSDIQYPPQDSSVEGYRSLSLWY